MRGFRVMHSTKTSAVFLGVVLLVGVACSTGSRDNDRRGGDEPSPSVSHRTPSDSPPSPSLPPGAFGAGMYEIGREVKPGSYTCTTRDNDVSGYWERARNASGAFDSIIANDHVEAGTQAIVTVRKGEFFKTERLVCRPR